MDAAVNEPLDAVEWARTVEAGRALELGEIEAEVMRRRIPPKRRLGAGARVGQVVAAVLLGVLGLAVLAAPIVGTGIVLAHAAGVDPLATDGLLALGRIAFVVTASLPLAIVAIWWNARDRRRRWWDLPAVALVTLLAAAAAVAVLTTDADFGTGFVLWILAAVVTGIGAFVGIAVASRRGPAPVRVRQAPDEERYGQVRAEAYDVLVRRGLADRRDSTAAILDMPRGGWIERDRQRGVR